MFDSEQQIHDSLTSPARQRRFEWLITNRQRLALIIAELGCWGIWDVPAMDRQLGLLETAIYEFVADDPETAVALSTEYVVRDSALIHGRGNAPFDCAVCKHGAYGLGDILARLPAEIE